MFGAESVSMWSVMLALSSQNHKPAPALFSACRVTPDAITTRFAPQPSFLASFCSSPTFSWSKNHGKLTPRVQSTSWFTTTKSLGFTSSLKLPTALKPTTHLTPSFLSAATLARNGTSWGAYWWWTPCRARKAIVIGCDRFSSSPSEEAGGV